MLLHGFPLVLIRITYRKENEAKYHQGVEHPSCDADGDTGTQENDAHVTY